MQVQLLGFGQELIYCILVYIVGVVFIVIVDYNLLFYEVCFLWLQKQFVGYSEEVLDVWFFGFEDFYVVVVFNSFCLKVFELQMLVCQIFYGYMDIVLVLDVFWKGWFFVSCVKDQSVCIWRMNKVGQVMCVVQGFGYIYSVGIVCCFRLKEFFLVIGSQDCIVKLWFFFKVLLFKNIVLDNGFIFLQVQIIQCCYDKDINSVVIVFNDKLLVIGLQDCMVKFWVLLQCQLLGVFLGYWCGFWCVQFFFMDQVLVMVLVDGIIKFWVFQDFSCFKIFEGYDVFVLKVVFVSCGMQLLFSGLDGFVKFWIIKNNECVWMLDVYEDKVWGLYCSWLDDYVFIGVSDF